MVTRRAFLQTGSALGLGAVLSLNLTGEAFAQALALPAGPFQYGVASGDPWPDGFVIWTRVTPDPSATPGSGLGAPVEVEWFVSTVGGTVAQGTYTTSAAQDHTVKVVVSGLQPGTEYQYMFRAQNQSSRVGTAKTAPAPDANPENLRFGFVSCSNLEVGWFAAYRYLAQRCDLDFVLHVGDYIYEYGPGGSASAGVPIVRPVDPPNETVTLEDYRRRHAVYKADTDLQNLHAAAAWITTVDDHEVTNDTWREGAQNHQAAEGDYATRRAVAYQAYQEWMPIRPALTGPADELYRRFRFGNLADLSMLDLRRYRDAPPTTLAEVNQAGRTMTGTAQENWLVSGLTQAGSPRWRLIGNSVQFMQVRYPVAFGLPNGDGTFRNVDAWDGFTDQRARIQQALLAGGAAWDAVFLTGDIHSTWASDLPIDWATYTGTPTGSNPSAGTEFVCTSVTSDNLNELLGLPARSAQSIGIETALRGVNPHIKALEFDSHGASVIDVTADRVQCDWYYLADRTVATTAVTHALSMQTVFGTRTVVSAPAPLPNDCAPDPVVPEAPLPVMIPAAAALMLGGALAMRRRNQAPAHEDLGEEVPLF